MGWLKRLFSTTNNAETVVKEGMALIDNAFHTSEEKAKEKLTMMQIYYKMLESTKYMSVARRVIAFAFVGNYLLLINIAVIAYVFDLSIADRLATAIKEWLLQPVNIIVGFYFLQAIIKTGVSGKN